jgi:23S rRNA (guanosine2251-2'-O)-methyltransferase
MSDPLTRYIYGIHAISKIINSDKNRIKKLYFKKNALSKNLHLLYQKALENSLFIEETTIDQLTLLSQTSKHQGVVCELEDINLSVFDLQNFINLHKKPFILILDQIKDPGNLGACIRTANAVGCDLIIKRKSNSAPISPAVHKASCGGTSGLHIYESNDLNGIVKKLKNNNIIILGTDHNARSDYRDINKIKYDGICVIMGAEDVGISKSLKNICDDLFSIPIMGSVECLNISVACGIILYEVAKYR